MIKYQQQTGMTLIEVLITVLVLAVGLLGLSALQSSSVKAGMDISQRSQAMWLANSLVDRMRANPEAMTSYTSIDTTSSCSAPTTNCSDHGSNSSGSPCTPTQMAAFDMWEVACGQTAASAGVLTNAVDSLDVTAINITCEDGTCNSNREDIYNVEVVYTSKLVNSSKLLNPTARAAQQSQSINLRVYPTYAP